MSPDGITDLGVNEEAHPGRGAEFVDFNELQSVRAELDELHVNGRLFARLTSAAHASFLADQVRSVWERPHHERASAIGGAIHHTLDAKAAEAAWQGFRRQTRALSMLCYAHASMTFIVVPLVMIIVGPYATWRMLLAGLVASTCVLSTEYFKLHAALYPRSRYERWVHVISMMVLPTAASRCLDKLSRDSLYQYDWAVVTPLVCGSANAIPLLRQQFMDLDRSFEGDPANPATPASECARWFQHVLVRETRSRLELLEAGVFDGPQREDGTMLSYCPRCHAQFAAESIEVCLSCRVSRLVRFAASN